MSDFYKTYMESHEGEEGEFYCEVQEGLILRHVCVFSSEYYWATPECCNNEQYDFTDHPEFGEPEESTIRISQHEFESAWSVATKA